MSTQLRQAISAWKPRATTLLTVVVVAMTLGGSYVVARAIGVGHASDRRLVPVTREALVRSVARVVDARLSVDRLQILLAKKGAVASPGALLVAQQQKLAQIAGLAISPGTPTTGASSGADGYVAKTVGTAGALLTRQLASLIAPDAIEALSLKGDATDASAVEGFVGKSLAANHADLVTSTWVGVLSSEPSLQHAWMLLDAGETFDSFLRAATSELAHSIARQVATDLTLATVPATETDSRGSDLSARLAWAIAAVLFIGLWTAAVAVAGQQITAFAPHPSLALAGTVLAGTIAGWLVYWSALTPASLEVLGPLLRVLETQRHTQIAATSRVLGALSATSVVVLLAAAWAILQGVPASAQDDGSHEQALRARLDGLRMIFNAGASLLVAGTVEIAMLYEWPAVIFGSSGELKTAAWLAGAFAGALFSVILSLVYLPTASVLRTAVRNTMPADQAATLLDAKGLNDTAAQQIGRILQALAPMLAAVPLSTLASALRQ